MKKSELLERIEQLEQQVATMERRSAGRFSELDLLLRGMLDPTREAFERDYPLPTTQRNEAAFTKGRQCGMNVLARLAAEAGQPSMTVTAADEKDADLAKAATQALKVVPAPRAPILLYPHSLEGFHVGAGTAHQIDKLASTGSLESNAALMDFMYGAVEKVMWCGKVGKIDGLEGVFKYEMDGDVFKVDYQGADLGNYSLMDGWWLKRIA